MKQNRCHNDLRRAMHFVAQGELQIAKQRQLIERLKSQGGATKQAEAVLITLQRSHLQMSNYLETLRALMNIEAT
jgi:hypothetical protein